ncbi:reactive oxygen species modulator 1-like [Acomys russatus]|uniref:reactive oxygen species modulator 1-like n=1 Tax=Acomys russatus TaxID=60746 RepID=UPI0021E1CAB3|nr:reactive oxygen species modulator 1-like [Acomys russatus]
MHKQSNRLTNLEEYLAVSLLNSIQWASSTLRLALGLRRRAERLRRRRDAGGLAVGPYRQSQPSSFNHVKMGFVMGCAVDMAAGALFGTFSCFRIGMLGQELIGGTGKTMMQGGSTFGTFMAIGMGIQC